MLRPFRVHMHELARSVQRTMAGISHLSLRNLSLTVRGSRSVLELEVVSARANSAPVVNRTAWAVGASGSFICSAPAGATPNAVRRALASLFRTATNFAPQPVRTELWVQDGNSTGMHVWERAVFELPDGSEQRLAAVHASLVDGKLHVLEMLERARLDASGEVIEALHRSRGDITAEDADTVIVRQPDRSYQLRVSVGDKPVMTHALQPTQPLTTLVEQAPILRAMGRSNDARVVWSEFGGFAGEGVVFIVRNRSGQRLANGEVQILSADETGGELCALAKVGTCERVTLAPGSNPQGMRRVYVTWPLVNSLPGSP
ncbi:MAG TPA: hypothetical protein ENJ18_01660 [Nannocystis exedens]|nr:hypothetical protein [Nannocystis exedens]